MTSTTTTSRKPILIAGGGLASLLLAQSLRRASIPFQVFEREASFSFRAQGYRLRLSNEGLDAIEDVLGPEQFSAFWDACGKTSGSSSATLNAVTGEEIEEAKPKDSGKSDKPRMELKSRDGKIVGISRGAMREHFMKGCEPYIKWSSKVVGYELTGSGVHAVFADGTKSDEGEMLIGGEGISSRVAEQLSEGKLKVYDTGARGIHGEAPTTAFKQLGEGVWMMRDTSRSEGSVFTITNVRSGDAENPDINFGWTMGAQPGIINVPGDDYAVTGKPAADIAQELTKNWNPRIRPLFEQMNVPQAAFWKITCSTPSGVPEWKNEPRVSVIGDAVHSMTPAGGLGANTAVRDSALLGRLIRESQGLPGDVTAVYEKEMRVYASETVGLSYGMATGQFGIKIDENTPVLQRSS